MLNTYAALFRTQINYRFQYRINMIFWLIMVTTNSIVYMAVWQAVADSRGGTIQGFNAADFAAYYLVLTLVQNVTLAPQPSLLARRIRMGDLWFRLLQPLHPMHRDIVENIAYKAPMLAFFVPVALLMALIFEVRFTTPLWSALLAIPALIGASVLRFVLHYVIMTFAFWIVETDGIGRLHLILQLLFGGILAPISLLPEVMRSISYVLPFRWIFAFPIDLALGRLALSEAWIAFGVQLGWIIIGLLLFKLLWRAGVKHYGAVGG